MITMAFFSIEVVIFLILLLQMHGFQLDDPRWFSLCGDLIWMCSGISRIREGLLLLDGVWGFVPIINKLEIVNSRQAPRAPEMLN